MGDFFASLEPGVSIRPVLRFEDVGDLVREHYGVEAEEIVELNGYDDKNFHVKVGRGKGGEGFVFKVINSLDSKKGEFFDGQNSLLVHVGRHGIRCPQPIPTIDGPYCKKIRLESGEHIIRLLEFIPGTIFHQVACTPDLLYQVGEIVGKMQIAIKDFHHPAYDNHENPWMITNIPKLQILLYSIPDEKRRSTCREVIEEFDFRVSTSMETFERGMIHGDFNEQNLLVEKVEGKDKIEAVLDFGDSHLGCYLFDIAITMAYMIVQAKSLDAGGYVLAGYLSQKVLREEEYALLKICVTGRICQSLVMGAYSHSLAPENSYILSTSVHGWKMLEELWKEPEEKLLETWKIIADEFVQNESG